MSSLSSLISADVKKGDEQLSADQDFQKIYNEYLADVENPSALSKSVRSTYELTSKYGKSALEAKKIANTVIDKAKEKDKVIVKETKARKIKRSQPLYRKKHK